MRIYTNSYYIKAFIIIVTYFFVEFTTHAFVVAGNIVDSENDEPLPYTFIHVSNGGGGYMSDENGYFKLTLPDSLDNPMATFRYCGRKSLDIELKSPEYIDRHLTVKLTPQPVILPDMSVYPTYFGKTFVYGKKKATGYMPAKFNLYDISKLDDTSTQIKAKSSLKPIMGIHVKAGKRKLWLDKLRFYMIEKGDSSVKSFDLRLSVYDFKEKNRKDNKFDWNNLIDAISEPLYLNCDLSNLTSEGYVVMDLEEKIPLKDESFVVVELLKSDDIHNKKIYANSKIYLGSSPFYMYDTKGNIEECPFELPVGLECKEEVVKKK